jgi:DNA repair exonuclease SbcCD ATPase subunit
MAAFALQALAWYAAALSFAVKNRDSLELTNATEAPPPPTTTTPVPFRSLQDDIDELYKMLEESQEEDEKAVEDVLEKANETEETIEEAYNETDTLHEEVEEGKVNVSSKNNETISEGLEDSAKANKAAKKEMQVFKETAHEKLLQMKERAREMMLKYRELAEASSGALDHARDLEKNLTSAHETMTVAKDTMRASILHSEEAYDMLVTELKGLTTTSTTQAPDPSMAWVGAGLWLALWVSH